MNSKRIIIYSLVSIITSLLVIWSFTTGTKYEEPGYIYQVYLDGEKIGLIDSEEKLYKLINEEQIAIKEEYQVNQVYPPKGFEIIRTHTYDEDLSTVKEVYEKIKEEKQFTIKGYTVTVKTTEEGVEPTYIYMLDEEIFNGAVTNVINTFITEERYNQYLTQSQPEIIDTGYIIEKMFFDDKITIKESYVSVDEKIYTTEEDLTKYLLFGDNINRQEYTVIQGDTIEKIAESHQLNVDELLIANDAIDSEDTLLAIGQTLNVALIDPVLSLVYEELVVEDVEQMYNLVVREDPNQYTSYNVIAQAGSKGINRVTKRVQFTNGEQNQGVAFIGDPVVIVPAVDQITIKGTKKYSYSSNAGTGSYIDTGQIWGWPTNQPSVITSHYGWRWGTLHDGLDISGTGYGSPIYAILDGEVVSAQYGGMVGSSAGYNVVIRHDNGYYSVYAHMSGMPPVRVGQWVTRGQRVGSMGRSGVATGTHLHLGLFYGKPYNGGYSVNPMRIYQ
jgi:murein DD-endopeptidase MepM/ murein hydrolase activator NlpD